MALFGLFGKKKGHLEVKVKVRKKKKIKEKLKSKIKLKNKKYIKKIKKSKSHIIFNKPIQLNKLKKPVNEEFIKTDIPGFDELLGQGIPFGSTVLVEGGPGSGKTIFCLTALKNFCERGKKVLYMSFEEPEERLLTHMEAFGAKPKEYINKKLLYVRRFNALDIARSVEALLSEAKKELLIDVQPVLIPKDFEPDIVLIDSLSSISSAFSGESSRFRIYMEQLFRYLEAHNITSFLVREVSNPSHIGGNFVEAGEAVSFLSDGIIVLYNVFYKDGKRKRALEILKMRGSQINRKIVECDIQSKKGIVIYPKKQLKGNYILT